MQYIFKQPKLNIKQHQWMELISKYNFDIQYVLGKENKVADALSRKRFFANSISLIQTKLGQTIKEYLPKYPYFGIIYLHLKNPQEVVHLMENSINFVLENDGLLYYNNKLFIPNLLDIKNMIIKDSHDIRIARHYGFFKTYIWPKMKTDIREYVQKCLVYQQVKDEQCRIPKHL